MRELKPKRRIPGLRWLLRGILLLVLALSAGRYAWGVYGDRVWAREIARYANAATPIAGVSNQGAVPAEEDAATDLIAAAKQIAADPRGNWVLNDVDSFAPLDDEQLVLAAGLLRRLDGVWPKLDAAERKRVANWNVEGDFQRAVWQVNQVTPFVQIAARYYHQTGDDRRALACVHRILRLADIAARAGDGYFEGIRQVQAAAQTVLQITPDLRIGTDDRAVGEAEVGALIALMLDESAARPALIRALEDQRRLLIEDTDACANGGFPRTNRLPTIIHEPWVRRLLLKPMFQTDAALMLHQVNEVIAAAGVADDVPTLLSLAPEAGGLRALREENPYLHLWAYTCWTRYEQFVRQHFQLLAERRMAAAALALRVYSIKRGGEFPARLDALVPEWLPAVPNDPMAHGRLMTYRPEGADPILYSVSRDGIDDGGSDASPNRDWTLEDGNWSQLWWKRDAVVHLRGIAGGDVIP